MRLSTLASLFVFGVLVGCDGSGPGAVGAPCNTAEDCEGGLICDVHNDQGSCQEPHGHGESEDDAGSESDSDSTSTTSTSATSAGETTDPTGTTETTGGVDTDAGESSGSSSGEVAETSGGNELCVAFCGCMQAACSGYEAYPYADETACMTACEAFDDVILQCFGGFCQQAMDSEGSLAEHYCEHAWGELGTQKC